MNTDSTKKIYDKMVNQKFVVSLMGNFDQDLLLSLINITENKLSGMDVHDSLKRKIFHFMVECSQNLLKSDKESDVLSDNIFLIGQEGESYNVHLGGILPKATVQNLIETVEEVNTLKRSDLRKSYYDRLFVTKLGSDNLLLLSMLSIARKTGQNIDYELIELDEVNSFLSFKTSITH